MTGESSYQSVTGSSSAPVCWASSAGPAGIRAVSPKNRTSTPEADRVAVGDQADQAAVAQAARERAEGGAAAVRQDLHAEALAVGDEPVVQGLRLQPLGDRGERDAQLGGDPGARQVPVGEVGQGEDDALAGGHAVDEVVHVRGGRSRS
ncbi:hypothetical protein GCM10020256_64590 [Streptomyces thermocoprophilus]